MKTFQTLLLNTLIASVTNNFVWFALTYWVYIETQSVLATSITGGVFLTTTALSGFWFGSIVDHHKKKNILVIAALGTLAAFTAGTIFYIFSNPLAFNTVSSPSLWILIILLLGGVIVGNIRNIVMPTLVTMLVPENNRDKANGMLGTTAGISFGITSVASGLILGFFGMTSVLVVACILTIVSIVHLFIISIPEKGIVHTLDGHKKIDMRGTLRVIAAVPGLFALIFFTTFNNLLGGVFMALMDAYGLSLVSVKVWGILWGIVSSGFIIGGILIAKKGLGSDPLKNLFRINIITWTVCIFFTIQPSIVLLFIGTFIWMVLVPFIEATEHTIIQKVVPLERQGRVFGFAQSVEQAASPLTAFLIGPVAQFIFIPFMTTGKGVDLIGSWYGTGLGRGIGLVFSITGIIGLMVTLIAMRSSSYQRLAQTYQK